MGRIRVGKRWRQDAERTNQLAKLLLEKRPQASALDGDGDDSTGVPPLSRIAGQVYFHGKIMVSVVSGEEFPWKINPLT